MFNIIGKRKIFLGISLLLVIASIVSVAVFGFRQGIDFQGGSLWQINTKSDYSAEEVRVSLEEIGVEGVVVSTASDGSFLVRFKEIGEDEHKNLKVATAEKLGEFKELSFQSIGPTIGKELRERALWAVFLVLFGISLYVAFAFRKVSFPVTSWKYGVVALITLFHDVIIPVGVLAWLGRLGGVEMDTNFVVALLVIAGFSVHDTIVVFDRTRENLKKGKGEQFSQIVNKSVNETLARSINTSATLLFVLLALYFAGPITLQFFILTILIGTLVGTYSSICVASPLLVEWYEWGKGR